MGKCQQFSNDNSLWIHHIYIDTVRRENLKLHRLSISGKQQKQEEWQKPDPGFGRYLHKPFTLAGKHVSKNGVNSCNDGDFYFFKYLKPKEFTQ